MSDLSLTETDRGFEIIEHPSYTKGEPCRLVQQSSAIGDPEDAIDRPGTSFLWVGKDHHLSRDEAREFGERLIQWAETGSLRLTKEQR